MEKAKYFLWGLVGLTSIWSLIGLVGGGSGEMGGMVKEQQVLSDVFSAVQLIECGYSDTLSHSFTPTQAAENYIGLVNSEAAEAAGISREAGKLPPKPLKHVIGEPDAPWEVVLQPIEEGQKIIILGFGEDMKKPIMKQEVLCK